MLLGNSLYDRQAQPRPLFAGGHIGLNQQVPVFLGQAPAIVDDLKGHPSGARAHAREDYTVYAALRVDCFTGVLHQIGE